MSKETLIKIIIVLTALGITGGTIVTLTSQTQPEVTEIDIIRVTEILEEVGITVGAEEDILEIEIGTWVCPTDGYKQDFEPTKENMAIHFPKLGLSDYECPTKRGEVMVKETDPNKKMKMNIRIKDKYVTRDATEEEEQILKSLQNKINRVEQMLEIEPDRQALKNRKAEFEAEYNLIQTNIQKEQKLLKAATIAEIKAFKEKYEDR